MFYQNILDSVQPRFSRVSTKQMESHHLTFNKKHGEKAIWELH